MDAQPASRLSRPTNPETAAACQLLYALADTTSAPSRQRLFQAIHHLTGRPLTAIARTWAHTHTAPEAK